MLFVQKELTMLSASVTMRACKTSSEQMICNSTSVIMRAYIILRAQVIQTMPCEPASICFRLRASTSVHTSATNERTYNLRGHGDRLNYCKYKGHFPTTQHFVHDFLPYPRHRSSLQKV